MYIRYAPINEGLFNDISNKRWLDKDCNIEYKNFYIKKLIKTEYITKLNPEEFQEKIKNEYLKYIRKIKIKKINKNV